MFSLKVLLGVVLASAIAGCASYQQTDNDRIKQLISSGQCDRADSMASQMQSGADQYALKGWVALDCRNNRTQAIKYLNIAAKMGSVKAGQALQRLGEPVPNVPQVVPKPVTVEVPNVQPAAPTASSPEGYSNCVRGPQGSVTCYRPNGTGTKCRQVGIQIQCRGI